MYWIIYLKTERKRSKKWDSYTFFYLIIWSSIIIIIPVLTSSLITRISVFKALWPGFILIGIVLIILGIKFGKLATNVNKVRGLAKGNFRLITKGPYNIMRHPMYTAWAMSFFGLALVFDSLIALLITPFFIILLEFEGYLEEKYILLPKFKEHYEKYKEKVPDRLFPSPYSGLLIIIAIIAAYVGFLNLFVNI
ncbi:MAG: methyltransferase family protein [Promethearchaeota archaeon]